MEVTQEQINAAYAIADKKTRVVLDSLFGKDSRPIEERIRTFNDACEELNIRAINGDEDAEAILSDYEHYYHYNSDTSAYIRLRIIVAALNDGWTPRLAKGKCRWHPWYALWTQEEYDVLTKERQAKCRRVDYYPCYNASANGSVLYAEAIVDASGSDVTVGSYLEFRTKELALYAGEQFMDIYAQWLGFEIIKEDK